MTTYSDLKTRKSFYYVLGVVLLILFLAFGYFFATEQGASYSRLTSALLQRQAITLSISLSQQLEEQESDDYDALFLNVTESIPEIREINLYQPQGGNFLVVASSLETNVGLVSVDQQKQKALASKETVTYQKQVIRSQGGQQIEERQMIPVLPVLDENGNVTELLEVVTVVQDPLSLSEIVVSNSNVLLGVFAGLSCVFGWYILKLRYSKELLKLTTAEQLEHKDELLATAAHDLRGPLIVLRQNVAEIFSSAENLSGTDSLSAERLQKLHKQSLDTVQEMTEFLENLLVVSRFERGKQQVFPRPEFLQEVIKDQLDKFTPQAEEKGLKILTEGDVESLPKLVIDPAKISEVLANYLSNAIKYSDKGVVRILVDIRQGRKEKFVVVGVQDQGMGIEPDNIAKLFKSFSRVGEGAKTRKGNGLGLYIAKQIVEQHGGSVGVKSTVGQGSTFFFSIPVPSAQVLEDSEVA